VCDVVGRGFVFESRGCTITAGVSCSNREGAQLQLGFVVEETRGFLPSPSY
jgi:hypothetical protein